MKIDDSIVWFSDCDDNTPRGEWTGKDGATAEELRAYAHEFACGHFYVALDDTGESERTGQGPYYLFMLEE